MTKQKNTKNYLYTALAGLSATVLNLIASSGIAVTVVLLAVGAALILVAIKKKSTKIKILGIIFAVLGLLGLMQATGIMSDVPILAFGIPAVLSVYFDLFSGFVQALVFSLLSMVYIAGSCPEPAEAES